MKNYFSIFILLSIFQNTFAQKHTLPTKAQLAWQETEFYLFAHFGPNTFTDKEWGEGTEPENVFNPTNLDCRQWCRIAKAAGAKGIIITAKHHDGFCLWPSKEANHDWGFAWNAVDVGPKRDLSTLPSASDPFV